MDFLFFIADAPDPEPASETDAVDWAGEMDARGVRLYGDRLRPADDATVVKVRGGETVTSSGSIAGDRDWIAGFDVIRCADMDEAVRIASRHPMARAGQIEIRPVWPFE